MSIYTPIFICPSRSQCSDVVDYSTAAPRALCSQPPAELLRYTAVSVDPPVCLQEGRHKEFLSLNSDGRTDGATG